MTRDHSPLLRLAGVTLTTAVLAAPAALAQDADDHRERARARFGWVKSDTHDDEHRSLEVVIENGDVTVMMDGEEVPDGNVIREDGKVIIRDADGNEIRTIDIGDHPGHMLGFSFGDGSENRVWVAGDAGPMAAPKTMLGIQLGPPGAALEHHLQLEPGKTTMIIGLYEGLPAHAAGLGEHDIITQIEGKPADSRTLRATLAEREPGDAVRLQVIQRGTKRHVEVKLAAYDRERMAKATLIGSGHRIATFVGGPGNDFSFGPGEDGFFGVADLDRIFVDDDNRVFELAPGKIPWVQRGDDFVPEDAGRPDLDGRLNRLDRRLADLQRVLDALVEEAKRHEEEQDR